MTISSNFVKMLFVLLSIVFMLTYTLSTTPHPTFVTYALGIGLGLIPCAAFIGLDTLFRRFNLRALNITTLGLFFGYLLAKAIILVFNGVLEIAQITPDLVGVEVTKIAIFLCSIYLGMLITLRASNEIYASIPFIRFSPSCQKNKDILLDMTALHDPRMIDLASSGLLDRRLILPRCLLRELQPLENDPREKRALDVVKRLETLPHLKLRYQDTDFDDIDEPSEKVLRIARLLNADVLTADSSCIQTPHLEGTRFINIHVLSKALKPLMQRGECLKIKIQRVGKEDMQGVGYLEDGTMVVVNGAGEAVGEIVEANVLSVKHSSTGRLIFCNLADQGQHATV